MSLIEYTEDKVKAVEKYDSIFGLVKGYNELKEKEFNVCMKRGNFNAPPSQETTKCLSKLLHPLNKKELNFIVSVFRCAVIFRIIDQLKLSWMPSKEKIVSDFIH
jgi:hypothetical protein